MWYCFSSWSHHSDVERVEDDGEHTRTASWEALVAWDSRGFLIKEWSRRRAGERVALALCNTVRSPSVCEVGCEDRAYVRRKGLTDRQIP